MLLLSKNNDDEELKFDFNKKAEILVIDDSHFNLIAAKLLFNQFGLACDIAISGKKGIKLFKQRLESQR